jgi:hypothetical protein
MSPLHLSNHGSSRPKADFAATNRGLAVLALLAAIPANRLAAVALAELLSRRRSCERIAEALVRWSRAG